MEHIIAVHDTAAVPSLLIPYVMTTPYDRGSFLCYPERCGIDVSHFRKQMRGDVKVSTSEWAEINESKQR